MSRILNRSRFGLLVLAAAWAAMAYSAVAQSAPPTFEATSNVQPSTNYSGTPHRTPLWVGESMTFTVNVFSKTNEAVTVSLAAEVKRDGKIVADVFPFTDPRGCFKHASQPFFGCAFRLQAGGVHYFGLVVHPKKAGRYCVHLWGYTSSPGIPAGRIAFPNKCTYVVAR